MTEPHLKKILDEKGWTQDPLAKKVRVSVGEIYRWIHRDCNPILNTLSRIAEAVEIKTLDLLDESET
ncbi:MAG: helix-turn-helix transcriptional regulator [Bdellovibrionales bacterium]|nr:helix-turn-helix transcriptional regulator [Bdellovibrionales bacterium]